MIIVKSSLVYAMTWCLTRGKPFSKMMTAHFNAYMRHWGEMSYYTAETTLVNNNGCNFNLQDFN